MSYAVMTVKTLFSMKTCNLKLSFDGGPLQNFDRAIFLAAMNFPCEGGGVPMAPKASATDGKLTFALAAQIPKWKCFFAFPFLLAAKQHLIRGFFEQSAKTLDVFSSPATISHTDGELFGTLDKVHYECLPQKLRLLF